MKDFLRVVFNVAWVIVVGFFSAISSAFMGISCCLTIIGIPFGLQHFKFIKLVFAPAGKAVALRFKKYPVANTLWLIFGGFASVVVYTLFGILMTLTVIGYPLAKQLFKIAEFNFAPFGCEVVQDGEWTSTGDTNYDLALIIKRFFSNRDLQIGSDPDGKPLTAWQSVDAQRERVLPVIRKMYMIERIVWIASFVVSAVAFLATASLFIKINTTVCVIVSMVVATLVFVGVTVAWQMVMDSIKKKELWPLMQPLKEYYPQGSVVDGKFARLDGVMNLNGFAYNMGWMTKAGVIITYI